MKEPFDIIIEVYPEKGFNDLFTIRTRFIRNNCRIGSSVTRSADDLLNESLFDIVFDEIKKNLKMEFAKYINLNPIYIPKRNVERCKI